MGKVIAVGAALLAAASLLSACDRGGDADEHETVAAPNMVETEPAAPANTVTTPIVRSAATAANAVAPSAGDPTQIEEDAAAVGMTARHSATTTTTTTVTATGAAPGQASAPPTAP